MQKSKASYDENISIAHAAENLVNDPSDLDTARRFLATLRDDKGVYFAQEDTLFDYKRTYPHSHSDDYFIAICRLILSFFNSQGGVVIFGVDDMARTAGHNKKVVNIERLNTRLRELTAQSLNVRHLHIPDDYGDVELLVVPKRAPNAQPAALKSQLQKYPEGTIWIRRGHESLEAKSRDIPFLFSARNVDGEPQKLLGYLPPSPSTIGKFVGRIELLSELLNWISTKDEPRMFLWGRGGSGKSTVAHEFASLIRDYGKSINTYEGETFERVIFLSAKERELNTGTGKIQDTTVIDFSDYEEMLRAILIATDYSGEENFDSLEREEL